MKSKARRVSTMAAVGLLIGAAAALAHDDRRPQVDPTAAEIVLTHFKGKTRSCEGQDGFYAENKNVVATGSSTGDSRLSGSVTIKWDEYFNLDAVEPTDEAGPFIGSIVIRDPVTGRKKMQGEFHNAGPLDMVQGVIFGQVFDEGTGPDEDTLGSGDLVAHWRITYGANGSISARIGGGNAPDARFPASISSGPCTGPFEQVEHRHSAARGGARAEGIGEGFGRHQAGQPLAS